MTFFIVTILLVLGRSEFIFGDHDETIKISLLMPHVQPLQPETYLCTAFRMPKYDHEYVVEFQPNASMHTAHHILIYGCKYPGRWDRDVPRYVWDCGEMSGRPSGYEPGPTCAEGSQIIYAWAKDAPPLKLPPGVAFKVGKGSGIDYLVLQVHYAHVEKFRNGGTDDSGIILTALPSWNNNVTKSAGVFLLGTGGAIPPRSTEYMETACKIEEPLQLHPFAFRTHAHALGKVVSGYKIDKLGKWKMIGQHDPQQPQMFYPVENKNLVIDKGDIVAARCTMKNFRSRYTFIGATAEDEMCNFYMMYYVDGDEPMKEKYCFSAGPPDYYWNSDIMISNVPQSIHRQASTLNGNFLPKTP